MLFLVSKHVSHSFDACHQGIHFFMGVVDAKGGTEGAFYAEAMHQGLSTMVARADGYAEAIEQGAHVEVVDVANEEGDDTTSLWLTIDR